MIKKISDKQKVINKQLKAVYEEIAQERMHICSNCGTLHNLSHSHLISREKNPSLQTVKENIVYHCIDKCHSLWEGKNIKTVNMNDFKSNMATIKKLDPNYYKQLVMTIENNIHRELTELE